MNVTLFDHLHFDTLISSVIKTFAADSDNPPATLQILDFM